MLQSVAGNMSRPNVPAKVLGTSEAPLSYRPGRDFRTGSISHAMTDSTYVYSI